MWLKQEACRQNALTSLSTSRRVVLVAVLPDGDSPDGAHMYIAINTLRCFKQGVWLQPSL